MKIGILTLPFILNYGGILLKYALQTVLKREGFDPYVINLHYSPTTRMRFTASLFKRWLLKNIFRKNIPPRIRPTKKEALIVGNNLIRFEKENINLTKKFYKNIFKNTEEYAFDAFIVGSDQVWRPKYVPNLTSYFLDFLDGNNQVKKITYAASFGVDNWEFTAEETIRCSALVKQFSAISVREESAIELCKKYLNVEAIHALDPTMLLKKEDYINLVEKDNIPVRDNILFSYILDGSDKKNNAIQKAIKELKLHHISGMPSNSFAWKESKKDLSDCIYSPVTEWLSGFRDAKFVITDSFHGTMFSIIFNKPFVVFLNEHRGNARFSSILRLFNLEDRIITSSDFNNKLFYLDYSEINKKLEKERDKSIAYLLNALNY